jgi:hypothetical protein
VAWRLKPSIATPKIVRVQDSADSQRRGRTSIPVVSRHSESPPLEVQERSIRIVSGIAMAIPMAAESGPKWKIRSGAIRPA